MPRRHDCRTLVQVRNVLDAKTSFPRCRMMDAHRALIVPARRGPRDVEAAARSESLERSSESHEKWDGAPRHSRVGNIEAMALGAPMVITTRYASPMNFRDCFTI
jgi:hypothetical protein